MCLLEDSAFLFRVPSAADDGQRSAWRARFEDADSFVFFILWRRRCGVFTASVPFSSSLSLAVSSKLFPFVLEESSLATALVTSLAWRRRSFTDSPIPIVTFRRRCDAGL